MVESWWSKSTKLTVIAVFRVVQGHRFKAPLLAAAQFLSVGRHLQLMKSKLRMQKQRDFKPHHILINAASNALEDAKEERPGFLITS